MGLFDFLTKIRDKFDSSSGKELRPGDELWEAVNLVVKQSHPNIHYVSNYQKKLMPAVEHTLEYANGMILQMPQPVPIQSDAWNTNPFIRAIFLDNRQFLHFFSENKRLQTFFKNSDAARCCALLVMTRENRKMLGVETDGEIIKRDVLQTSINFTDHQIVAPMATEEETRKELSLRMLSLLASHCLEDIHSLVALKKDMETEKRMLEMTWHLQEARIRSQKSILPDAADDAEETGKGPEMIEQLDRKIEKVRVELYKPEDYLNKVTDLLYHPERFLKAELVRLRVSDMNIIVKQGYQGTSNEISFVEFSTSTEIRKAAFLVDCLRP